MLSLNQVSKSFADHTILDNIDLSVKQGEIIGLAGPSGSGKSTLLRCIQGLEQIDGGEVHSEHEIGFMFQDFQLFPHMTVLDNLTFAPKTKNKKIDHTKKATDLLKKLSIDHKAYHYPHQLSGGQKQRAALARSLMMAPSILLCDEPTSGLDLASIKDVVTLLKSVQAMGLTMLIASHDLDFLAKVSSRIILLKEGSIKAELSPGQVNDFEDDLLALYHS